MNKISRFIPIHLLRLSGAALAIATLGASFAACAQGIGGNVWGGVYSAEQATRGKAVYEAKCMACHGAALGGSDSAPPLTGGRFFATWNTTSADDLFERIHTTMPAKAPGTLSGAQVAAVEAYIFQVNGFPAGEKPLLAAPAALANIRITANRPAR